MEKFIINGGNVLKGEVDISGMKNSAVALIPAALLSKGSVNIKNVPNIKDTRLLIKILNKMGIECEYEDGELKIDDTSISKTSFCFDEMTQMRASYYLIGAILGRYKRVEVLLPGGCNLGSRPIDLHLKAFEKLGATIKIEHGKVIATSDNLKGANICLDIVSVGATINAMLASVYAEGTTVIENAAKEPHIVDVAEFLNKMGADIKGAGTSTICINGVKELNSVEHSVVPDQIEAGTYMVMAAITKGNVLINNVIPKHLETITEKLREANVEVIEYEDKIRVIGNNKLESLNIKTSPYPGFPTDMQSQVGTLMCLANGISVITETIWSNRFRYLEELKRMGAKVKTEDRTAVITGVERLTGAKVTAPDLRGGVALVIGGLVAEGVTEVVGIEHIDRGYESIECNLIKLGAEIKRKKV